MPGENNKNSPTCALCAGLQAHSTDVSRLVRAFVCHLLAVAAAKGQPRLIDTPRKRGINRLFSLKDDMDWNKLAHMAL
ncbi:hypothetical protein RRG08_008667 [Elysia crispata]|uniref:Uncharacterized protein n=1 Tax=Elysia crispata TaxID=231223 RepID=A0AAE0XYE2_9GAST|nr:hypothetical protein RRG08_008667 [Elysia crispata]